MTAGLVATDVSVSFGGLRAVDHFSFAAPIGSITGLVGPNGAGKSTTFNACFGLVPSEGAVTFNGVDLTNRGTPRRALAGLGRTFQRMELFDSLTVRQNVEMGCEAAQAGRNPIRHLVATRRQRRAARTAAEAALTAVGIGDLADRVAGSLSLGQRRLVEWTRALAGPFPLLLLDEPASGLDAAETERFAGLLRSAVADGTRGILIVEHDIELVTEVCDRVYVLDFGKLIFEGTPTEMRASSLVRGAYLGGSST